MRKILTENLALFSRTQSHPPLCASTKTGMMYSLRYLAIVGEKVIAGQRKKKMLVIGNAPLWLTLFRREVTLVYC